MVVRFIQLSNNARRRGKPRCAPAWRVEHLLLKTLVVFTDHRNLEFFARAKMGKNARLLHLRHFSQPTDREALKPLRM